MGKSGRGSLASIDTPLLSLPLPLPIIPLAIVSEGRLTARDDIAGTAVAVRQLRRDGQLPLLPDAHVQEPLVPALDHLSDAQLEGEGLFSIMAGKTIHSLRLNRL